MPRSNASRNRRALFLPLLILSVPEMAHADAIFPSLALVWPITILLLIPVILIEALYSRRRLKLRFWESIRLIGVANLLSTVAGLPLAHLFSAGFQYLLESIYFGNGARLRVEALKLNLDPGAFSAHNAMGLAFWGLYPRWLLLLSVAVMLTLCFLVSWWVEAWWIARRLRKATPVIEGECWPVVRNANILSYSFLAIPVFWAVMKLWPQSVTSFLSHP